MKYVLVITASLLATSNSFAAAVSVEQREAMIKLLGTAKGMARVCSRGEFSDSKGSELMRMVGLDPEDEWHQQMITSEMWSYLNTEAPMDETRDWYCTLVDRLFGRDGEAAPDLFQR